MRLLLIEDEASLRAALVPLLEDAGYHVLTELEGHGGMERALAEKFDLILLDVMLPGIDGFAICRELRKRGREVPVLMLTARGTVEDRVKGLDGGADDYLVKPFSGQELLARIRALLRRASPDLQAPEIIRLGAVEVDFRRMRCERGGNGIDLTAREFRLLELLAAAKGKPVSREEFLDKAWDYSAFPTTRTVDNQILALRQKLEDDPAKPIHLVTVHGTGYRLENFSESGKS